MISTTLGEKVNVAAAAAQTAVEMTGTPFLRGRSAVVMVAATGSTGTPTVKVQGSDDGTTYTDLVTLALADLNGGIKIATITLNRYVRLNVTAAGTAGSVSAYLLGNV